MSEAAVTEWAPARFLGAQTVHQARYLDDGTGAWMETACGRPFASWRLGLVVGESGRAPAARPCLYCVRALSPGGRHGEGLPG